VRSEAEGCNVSGNIGRELFYDFLREAEFFEERFFAFGFDGFILATEPSNATRILLSTLTR
jgi:hypothetical protein